MSGLDMLIFSLIFTAGQMTSKQHQLIFSIIGLADHLIRQLKSTKTEFYKNHPDFKSNHIHFISSLLPNHGPSTSRIVFFVNETSSQISVDAIATQ